jgi:transposase
MTTMTRSEESTATTAGLLVAFELGERSWKLGFTIGLGQRPRIRSVPAGAMARVWAEIADAKARFKLAADTPAISCYEAGRDGCWIHRALVAQGVTSHVVDSSSIEVNRRARRTKSDRLDLGGLLTLLARYVAGTGGVGEWCGCRPTRRKMRGICIGRGKPCNRIARA